MKITLIFSLLISFSLFAQYDYEDYEARHPINCIVELENKYQLPEATTFDISACEDMDAVNHDLENFLILRSGYQFEWFGHGEATIEEAITFLETDHRGSDGSGPFSAEEINQIIDFYTKPGLAADEVGMIEFADSYYSGTGITNFVVLYNGQKSEIILIEKFVYAE